MEKQLILDAFYIIPVIEQVAYPIQSIAQIRIYPIQLLLIILIILQALIIGGLLPISTILHPSTLGVNIQVLLLM